jgi:hypothetical protein
MAELIYRGLARRNNDNATVKDGSGSRDDQTPSREAKRMAEIERRTLVDVLQQWWDWLEEL